MRQRTGDEAHGLRLRPPRVAAPRRALAALRRARTRALARRRRHLQQRWFAGLVVVGMCYECFASDSFRTIRCEHSIVLSHKLQLTHQVHVQLTQNQDDNMVRSHLASDGLAVGVQDGAHRAIRVALHDRAIRQMYLQQPSRAQVSEQMWIA